MEAEANDKVVEKPKSARVRRGIHLRDLLDLAFSSPWPWAVVFAVLLTWILTPGNSFRAVRYELGQIAPATIRAPDDLSYEDAVTTQARRTEAVNAVQEVYDFNDRAAADARVRIGAAFEWAMSQVNGEFAERFEAADEEKQQALAALGAGLQDRLGVTLQPAETQLLVDEGFATELENALSQAVSTVLARDIVASKERLLASGRPIFRRELISRTSQVRRDFSAILTVPEAQELVEVQTLRLSDLNAALRRRLVPIGMRFVEPTLNLNLPETERRRQEAAALVEPVYFQIQRGRTIIREGDEVTEPVLKQLELFSAAQGRGVGLAGAIGALLFSILMVWFLWKLLRPSREDRTWRLQSFAMVGLLVVVSLLLARGLIFVARISGEQIAVVPFNNVTSYFYAVPFASIAVLVVLLENPPTALLASVIFSVSLAMMTGNGSLAVFALISCLAAILGLFRFKRRTELFKVAFLVGGANIGSALAIGLISERYNPVANLSLDLLCAFVGGVAVSVVASFLLPGFESFFHRTTDIKLLELANNNIPVLRRLALEAPGTFHHSVVVGSLSEAAAETIGANPIFCRTAALYHDIGKLQKAEYFVENQQGPNKHDKLSPRMSALIIASHVKEGIEMAREVNLPQEIIDCIPQHHGTKLITYFFEKARVSQDPSLGEVTEEEFRYPGPKPQTREAGIIMIADAVEAASRTLDDPSPARLQGMIRQIIDYIFLDGQLNECDLTLRDLKKIGQSFLRVLMGIHHTRISYPGFDFDKKVEPVVLQDIQW